MFFVFVVQRKKSLHAVFILRDNINLQDVLWRFLFVTQDIRLILENTTLCKRYSHEPLTCRMSAQGTDTMSNARRFYSSMGNPLAGKGLINSTFVSGVYGVHLEIPAQ